jgi:hypothetical protein
MGQRVGWAVGEWVSGLAGGGWRGDGVLALCAEQLRKRNESYKIKYTR